MRTLLLTALLLSSPALAVTVPVVAYGELHGEITAISVLPLAAAIAKHPAEIHIRIDSEGGDVETGFELVTIMRAARRAGTRIVCTVPNGGQAQSMAVYVLQGCSYRQMGRQSFLMFHTISTSNTSGNAWALRKEAQRLDGLNVRMSSFIAGRLKLTLKRYMAQVWDRDWYVGAEEALAIGAVDRVF